MVRCAVSVFANEAARVLRPVCVIVVFLMTPLQFKKSSFICIHPLLFQLVFLPLLLPNLKAWN